MTFSIPSPDRYDATSNSFPSRISPFSFSIPSPDRYDATNELTQSYNRYPATFSIPSPDRYDATSTERASGTGIFICFQYPLTGSLRCNLILSDVERVGVGRLSVSPHRIVTMQLRTRKQANRVPVVLSVSPHRIVTMQPFLTLQP